MIEKQIGFYYNDLKPLFDTPTVRSPVFWGLPSAPWWSGHGTLFKMTNILSKPPVNRKTKNLVFQLRVTVIREIILTDFANYAKEIGEQNVFNNVYFHQFRIQAFDCFS